MNNIQISDLGPQYLLVVIYYRLNGTSHICPKANVLYRTITLFGDNSTDSRIIELQDLMIDGEGYTTVIDIILFFNNYTIHE